MINEYGELLAIYLTAAHRHELKALPKLVKRLVHDPALRKPGGQVSRQAVIECRRINADDCGAGVAQE